MHAHRTIAPCSKYRTLSLYVFLYPYYSSFADAVAAVAVAVVFVIAVVGVVCSTLTFVHTECTVIKCELCSIHSTHIDGTLLTPNCQCVHSLCRVSARDVCGTYRYSLKCEEMLCVYMYQVRVWVCVCVYIFSKPCHFERSRIIIIIIMHDDRLTLCSVYICAYVFA